MKSLRFGIILATTFCFCVSIAFRAEAARNPDKTNSAASASAKVSEKVSEQPSQPASPAAQTKDKAENCAGYQSAANPKSSPAAGKNSALSKKDTKSSGKLSCSPTGLRRSDILTLKMRSPHGGYLEIITPQKKYIFLSELDGDELVEAGKKAGANPFYAASEFTKLDELKINTASATTVDVEKNKSDGKYQLEKIFSVPGKYRILLSEDSFETDEPTITGRCRISFANIKSASPH